MKPLLSRIRAAAVLPPTGCSTTIDGADRSVGNRALTFSKIHESVRLSWIPPMSPGRPKGMVATLELRGDENGGCVRDGSENQEL
jgi:hypothetical protein